MFKEVQENNKTRWKYEDFIVHLPLATSSGLAVLSVEDNCVASFQGQAELVGGD